MDNLGYKTKYGSTTWSNSAVLGIIKNEKYIGDVLLEKTFTVDPISKRRLDNLGEEEKYYIKNNHEPIISRDIFYKAHEILNIRSKNRGKYEEGIIKREKYSRKYAFSCMMECGFCGGTLTRRNWHSGSEYSKAIWQCGVATKKGKKYCSESKGIPESVIENAFVESYRLLCYEKESVLDELLNRINDTVGVSEVNNKIRKIEKELSAIEKKVNKLVDMRLDDIIEKETYEIKYKELMDNQETLLNDINKLNIVAKNEKSMKQRLKKFKKNLEENEVLDKFDRTVFESIVEKVIIGEKSTDEENDPTKITFIYKTGFKNTLSSDKFKIPRKNARGRHKRKELCLHSNSEVENLCSYSSSNTCGNCS